MSQEIIQAYIQIIQDSVKRTKELVIGLTDEQVRRKAAEDVWSVMEILCHLEEMIPYWIHELNRVVSHSGGEWGRGHEHEGRLVAVEAASGRRLEDVVNGIEEGAKFAVDSLLALQDEDLKLEASHRKEKFGIKPMSFLVEKFITDHLVSHNGQIERTLTTI